MRTPVPNRGTRCLPGRESGPSAAHRGQALPAGTVHTVKDRTDSWLNEKETAKNYCPSPDRVPRLQVPQSVAPTARKSVWLWEPHDCEGPVHSLGAQAMAKSIENLGHMLGALRNESQSAGKDKTGPYFSFIWACCPFLSSL